MKDCVYSVRLETNDWEYYKHLKMLLSKDTGIPVSTTWVVTELLRMGMPIFEKKYNLKRPPEFLLDSPELEEPKKKPKKSKKKKPKK